MAGNQNKDTTYFPKIVEETLEKIAPKTNVDTSTAQQWSHLDIGTATFVTCIIIFSVCFSYLIPRSSNVKFIALIVALCITFIFPLSWVSSIVNYPTRNTQYYILVCIFVGIIFQFTALLMTFLTTNYAQEKAREQNEKLSQTELEQDKTVKVSPFILENNRIIYILFTTSVVLMIGSIATYFYDEVTIEKEQLSSGINIKPGSVMGTNIHWWLTFFYEKANDFDNWWHATIDMIPFPAVLKMFLLFVVGFLIAFFIFVDVRIYESPASDVKIDGNHYIKNDIKYGTSLPNTTSPLKQDGVFLLYDKIQQPAPVRSKTVFVRYLPSTFTAYDDINLFALLAFFFSLLLCILFIPTLYGIHLITAVTVLNPFESPMKFSIIAIVSFLLSFLLLYFYFPAGSNMTILYLLITFVFAFLGAPIAYMILEMFMLIAFQTSISQTRWGWYILLGFLVLIWGTTFGKYAEIFNYKNMINNVETNSSVLQLFTALLIAMTVGWFFGLSFHFDALTFLFVLGFTPIKYVLKIFGPITILALTIVQIIIASDSSNRNGKTTDG